MASTKTDTNLNLGGTDGYSLPVGSNMTTTTGTLTTGYGGLLLISISNAGTQTTTAATAQIQISNNGTSWYSYGGALSAPLTESTSWTVPISIAALYCNVYYTAGNSNSVTINTHLLQVTKI